MKLMAVGAILVCATPALAIYGRGNLDATGFDDVVWISGCSASIIGEHWVLTAKHVGGTQIWRNGVSYDAVARYDHPTADISLLKFNNSFASWYEPYYGDVLGKELTYVGYGLTASPRELVKGFGYMFTGYHYYDGTGGVKRKATNTAGAYQTISYDDWGAQYWTTDCIEADLDYSYPVSPASSRVDTLHDGGATAEEGGLLWGDSGSPAFVKIDGKYRVVGVNIDIRDANGPNPGGGDNFIDFGDVMFSSSVKAYSGWMHTTMSPVPEPASLTIIGFGFLGLLAKRRK